MDVNNFFKNEVINKRATSNENAKTCFICQEKF